MVKVNDLVSVKAGVGAPLWAEDCTGLVTEVMSDALCKVTIKCVPPTVFLTKWLKVVQHNYQFVSGMGPAKDRKPLVGL